MTPAERAYHHGDLNQALRLAAVELIAERGLGAFSLREVARRAGVSHAAPAHHFGDVGGLLTAVAIDGFCRLHEVTAAAAASTPGSAVDRLCAVGRAYVELAISNSGHCAVMMRHDVIDADDPRYQDAGDDAFGVLIEALVAVADEINPDLDVDIAAATCWSSMQGLIELHGTMNKLDERHRADGEPELAPIGDMADQITRMIVTGFGLS